MTMSASPPPELAPRATPVHRELRVADQIAEVLLRRGVDRVFGIPGGTISPVFDALFGAGIELVTCQHEAMAVYAAGGYAQVTGKPSVVAVTSGPGALNALAGLAATGRDELPVVVLAGEASLHHHGRAPLQDGTAAGLDLMTMVRSITKFAELAVRPERAPIIVDQALSQVSCAPFGSAFVALPVDVTRAMARRAQLPSLEPRPLKPDLETCRQLARMLGAARRPVIMLGVGAKRAKISQSVLELAEALRIPVMTDIEAKGVFPESHPLSLGVFGVAHRGPAHAYMAEPVDLMLSLGCRFDDTTTAGYAESLRPEFGHMVQLDHDPERIGRSYAPDLAMCADLAATMTLLLDMVPIAMPNLLLERDRNLRQARRTFEASEPRPSQTRTRAPSSVPHDPRRVAPMIRRALGRDAIVCSDIGNHLLFAAQNLVVDRDDGFSVSCGLGGMGSGIGTAIGMQLAFGASRQVVCVCGDGGMLMNGNELATCARYRIPLIVVVYNDCALGMVEHGFQAHFGRSPDFSSPSVDFAAFARSLGLAGVRLEALDEFATVVERHRGTPLLVDVPIDLAVRPSNARFEVLRS